MVGDPEWFARLLVQRVPYLRSLATESATKAELADELDVSRSTVDRAVRDLESANAVERREGGVALTLVGRLALTAYDDFYADLLALTDCAALTDLDVEAPITIDTLRGADVVDAPSNAPHRPVSTLVDFIEDAVHVSLYSSMVLPTVLDTLVQRIDEGLTVDAYLDGDALDALLSDYAAILPDVLETGRIRLAETTADYCFDFALIDRLGGEQVAVVACGGSGIDSLLVNDTADALEWARTRLDAVAADATPLN
ncbi:helix-turn-helix transcriptional regulator [Halarchaeum sp. P4]|uniref:helix-turn-helix transcriptional regulator n=1 Tax=Halarchaeum sp. P4 TaxID=3421639 RepID=UPI003EB9AD17